MRDSLSKTDIKRLSQNKPLLSTPYFILKARANQTGRVRLGFAFSRKSGKAVTRNRVKRRLRALISSQNGTMRGVDVFIIAKRPLDQLTEKQWQTEKSRIEAWFEGYQSALHSFP